jgi:ubiquinone biosynthesis protein
VRPFDFLAHAVRAEEIFSILARNGFADQLQQARAPGKSWRGMLPKPAHPMPQYERIRRTLEELGPTFVKFGQLLSMRPDLLPQPLILELSKLQDHVSPLPFEEMMPVLDGDLMRPHDDIFVDFDATPAASASLAQVYRAKVRTTGREVAIKVQKPAIKRKIEIDLDLAGWLAGQLHRHSTTLHPYDLPSVVEEVRKTIVQELDFRIEARNQEYFNSINRNPESVFAPEVLKELSSEHVLVTEWVQGTPPSGTPFEGEQIKAIAMNGATSLIQQILMDGFFHADPHAGNIIITEDGRIAFIDWGMAGNLTRRLRRSLAEFLIAAIEHDAERVVRIAAELGPSEGRPDTRAMESEVTIALREELNFKVGHQQLGRAMLRLLFIFGSNGIPLSREYSIMAKAVLSIEEVGRMLDPDFDLRTYAEPVLRQQQSERWGAQNMMRSMEEFAKTSFIGLRDLPSDLTRLMRRLEHDNLTVNFQHKGLEHLEETVGTAANRITLGVIVGALIVGSSLIVKAGVGPQLFGYPALGIVGYVISGLFGFYIVIDIVRHTRRK